MSAITKYSNYSQLKQVQSSLIQIQTFDKSGNIGEVIGSNGEAGLIWVSTEPISAAWSNYPAVSTIDASGNDISHVKNIGITGYISNNDRLKINFDSNSPSILMVNPTYITRIDGQQIQMESVATGNIATLNGNAIILRDSNTTHQTTFYPPTDTNYNLCFQGNGVNSKILLNCPANNPSVFLSNQAQTTYSQSNLTSLTYNDGTIETAKLDASAKTLTLNDGTNSSQLTTTDLTFNGVPYSRNMINSTLVYSAAIIYADGSAPATNLTIRNTYGYNGWYFAKTLPGTTKINWYLGAQSNNTIVSEIKGIAMSFFNQLATSNDYLPFITIYTQPQPGDVTFYHSKRTYIFDQTITPVINTAYQGCVFVNPTLIPYYREQQVAYELSPVGQVGPFLPSEKVLAITIGSDSAAPVNGTGFVVSKLNIIYDTFTQSLEFVPP